VNLLVKVGYKLYPTKLWAAFFFRVSHHAFVVNSFALEPGLNIEHDCLRTMFHLRFANAQYHQDICAVKSHSRARATFQNIGKGGKQEAI